MTTRLDIFNMALGHVGSSDQMQVPTETTKAGYTCRRYYDQCRTALLREFPWGFATRASALALVTDTPSVGYAFSYARPSGTLRIYTVCTSAGVRQWLSTSCGQWDSPSAQLPRVPWRIMGSYILTDQDDAYGIYVADATEDAFDSLFTEALTLRLAIAIAAPMMGQPTGQAIAARLGQTYLAAKQEAMAAAMNEQGQDVAPVSPAIQARW